MNDQRLRPLVYSCSGCSSAAQLTNLCAIELDRHNVAEMSCIAGVGGKVPPLLRIAHSGRPIIALDGCILSCVKESLAQAELEPQIHIRLDQLGIRKLKKTDFDQQDARQVYQFVVEQIKTLETT